MTLRDTTILEKRTRRHHRIRSRVHGTAGRPRLSVFRSGQHVFAQIINDDVGVTLVALADRKITPVEGVPENAGKKVQLAFSVGKLLAEKAKAAGVERVVFDRGGYAYHGRVKAIAEGARAGGLEF